ncbi:MAG TPA: sigma-70 family RNA polymerase sigma factor [Acidimicrobiales bacterium]
MTIETKTAPTMDGLDALYRTQRDRLRRIAYLMTGQAAVAEEIVHDAFIRVHSHLDTVHSPPAYLRTTVVRLCIAWQQRDRMARERTPYDRQWVDPPEIDEMWDRLAQLPPDQRVVLVLRYYEDLPLGQIADVMGCRPVTVRTRIHRALNRLRKEMTP